MFHVLPPPSPQSSCLLHSPPTSTTVTKMSLMNRLFRSSTVLLSAPASGDTVQSTESSSSTEDHIHEPKTAAPLPSSPHPAPVVQDDFTLPTPQSPLPPERRLEASRLASNLVMVLQRMPERDGMNVVRLLSVSPFPTKPCLTILPDAAVPRRRPSYHSSCTPS